MKQRKIPMRTCVVSHEKCEKKDLIRVVRNTSGDIEIDLSGKLNGRGAYLKKDVDVINKARKSKILDRHLEVEVPDKIYDELLNIIK